jgi:hypothetical protein
MKKKKRIFVVSASTSAVLLLLLSLSSMASCNMTTGGGSPQGPSTSVTVSTLAGSAGQAGTADGTGGAARFNQPCGVATDGNNVYVADTNNHTIRKIVISSGAVTTLAGTAGSYRSADGIGTGAQFNQPYGLTTDGVNLYVADSHNYTVREIVIASGEVTTLAGAAGCPGSADGTGSTARFSELYGVATDGTSVYVADTVNHTIRQIVIASAVVNTLAGSPGQMESADGTGSAARFNWPYGVATDGTNLYVADTGNCTIRKIVIASREVTTLAGTAGSGGSAGFYWPWATATNGTNVYVTDPSGQNIWKIAIANAAVTKLAGDAGAPGSTDGPGSEALFCGPHGIATDGADVFVADTYNDTIRRITGNF